MQTESRGTEQEGERANDQPCRADEGGDGLGIPRRREERFIHIYTGFEGFGLLPWLQGFRTGRCC